MERFGQDLLLLEKLAAGGMAEVHRAKQLGYGGFEKTVAVKRILPHYASSEEFKSMFRLEANLSGLLQHPNIVQIFTNGDFEGYLFLVMEFVDGKNLRQLLARADKNKVKIPVEIACHLIAEAAKGLEYAHNFIDEKTGQPLEVVHRDMSPQNIMLSYDGAVKIVDFGIAKAAARADVTRAGVLKGKFGYMSPEQAQGQKLDKRTDIFALGIILFEVLTQRRLFTTDDDLRTLQLVRECKVPRPSRYNPAVPPTLDRIVMRALARERSERYPTAGELYGDLLRFMNQTYPKFIPTDFSKFMKQLFVDDILDERKKREKMAAEAPARVAAPSGRSAEPKSDSPKAKKRIRGDEDTAFDEDFKTEISQLTGSNAFASGPNEVEAKPINGATSSGEPASEMSLPEIQIAEAQSEQVKAEPVRQSAPEGSAMDPNETRATGEGPSHDILPPPGEMAYAPTSEADLKNFSLSLPQQNEAATKGVTANDAMMNNNANNRPLTLALHDIPDNSAYTSPRPEPQIRPLKMRKTGGNRRVFLYGTALAMLCALIYFQQKDEGKMVADSSPGPSVKKEVVVPTPGDAGVQVVQAPASDAPPADGAPVSGGTPPQVERNVASQAPDSAPPVESTTPSGAASAIAVPAPSPELSAPTIGQTETPFRDNGSVDISSVRKGYITVNSRPRATEIYLNGELLRKPSGLPLETPLLRFAVPEGRYKLRLANPVFKAEWEEQIDVQGDKILSLNPTLK